MSAQGVPEFSSSVHMHRAEAEAATSRAVLHEAAARSYKFTSGVLGLFALRLNETIESGEISFRVTFEDITQATGQADLKRVALEAIGAAFGAKSDASIEIDSARVARDMAERSIAWLDEKDRPMEVPDDTERKRTEVENWAEVAAEAARETQAYEDQIRLNDLIQHLVIMLGKDLDADALMRLIGVDNLDDLSNRLEAGEELLRQPRRDTFETTQRATQQVLKLEAELGHGDAGESS